MEWVKGWVKGLGGLSGVLLWLESLKAKQKEEWLGKLPGGERERQWGPSMQ